MNVINMIKNLEIRGRGGSKVSMLERVVRCILKLFGCTARKGDGKFKKYLQKRSRWGQRGGVDIKRDRLKE